MCDHVRCIILTAGVTSEKLSAEACDSVHLSKTTYEYVLGSTFCVLCSLTNENARPLRYLYATINRHARWYTNMCEK